MNTGNNLLYLLVSALLGFMAVSGYAGHINIRKVEVRCKSRREHFSRSDTQVTLILKNTYRFWPLFLLSGESEQGRAFFAVIPPGEQAEAKLTVRFAGRGYQSMPAILLSSAFPVHFFIRQRQVPVSGQILVFPQPLAAVMPAATDAAPRQKQFDRCEPGQDGDLHSIAAYTAGHPLRSIHWRLSARQEGLKIKRFHDSAARGVIVDPAHLNGTLEERLGRATFLILTLLNSQRPVGLRLDDQVVGPATGAAHQYRLLRRLALYAAP